VVVHGISLPAAGCGDPWIDALFTTTLDPGAHPFFQAIEPFRVSARLLIRRSSEMIQYVSFHHRAWHAGQSSFLGRERCNDFSVGIELEGADTVPYTDSQYRCLAEVITALQQAYPAITPERLTGHSDIAPGRKSDPGPAFDWERLRELMTVRSRNLSYPSTTYY
jgi:AmpD protein